MIATEASLKALQKLEATVLSHYGPELWMALKAGLAVFGSLSLKDRAHPLALIFEGGSGRGKSLVINMCAPDREEAKQFAYRLDSFTPKAFVSHAANVSQHRIKQIDLLPKIAGKTLLTKELAPIFRGRDDELRANFATLTAVLDGKGHISASGVHGTRGYEGRYVFNWLGGTTPIPTRTDAIMAQLGNRLLRYEIVGKEQSEDELTAFAQSYEAVTREDECRNQANDFLCQHFESHPLSSVDPREIILPKEAATELARLALLIAHGRVEVEVVTIPWLGEREFVAGESEGPQRVILLLRTLAQGLVLINGRSEVGQAELETIRHVAFSSIPRNRRNILRAVLTCGGELTSTEAEGHLGISRPTAREWMQELAATGIVKLLDQSGNEPEKVVLGAKWSWLLPTGSSAESEMGVCAGTS